MTRPARLARMRAHAEALEFVFVTDDAAVPVTVELPPRTAHALRHLHALHAHADGCQGAPPMQLHDLLLRALRSLVGEPTCVLVRPGPCPAFWLQVTGAHGTKDLDLDVLDAACLLMSPHKVAVELLPTPPADWDQALRRLIAENEQPPPTH